MTTKWKYNLFFPCHTITMNGGSKGGCWFESWWSPWSELTAMCVQFPWTDVHRNISEQFMSLYLWYMYNTDHCFNNPFNNKRCWQSFFFSQASEVSALSASLTVSQSRVNISQATVHFHTVTYWIWTVKHDKYKLSNQNLLVCADCAWICHMVTNSSQLLTKFLSKTFTPNCSLYISRYLPLVYIHFIIPQFHNL